MIEPEQSSLFKNSEINAERDVSYQNLSKRKYKNRISINNLINEELRGGINLDNLVDKIFNKFSMTLRVVGPLFSVSLLIFSLIVASSFFTVTLRYYTSTFRNLYISAFITIVGSYLFFLLEFNYILAVIVKPGTVHEAANNKRLKIMPQGSYYLPLDFDVSEIVIKEANRLKLLNGNSCFDFERNCSQLDNSVLNYCKQCKIYKPLRAHHCSVCKVCVLKMDHHCPWINNCVGQNNHRYFILFISHLFLTSIFNLILILPLKYDYDYISSKSLSTSKINFITILLIIGSALSLVMSTWNWYLSLKGYTTIELFNKYKDYSNTESTDISFSFTNWRNNMLITFGQSNLVKVLFIPSIKQLPFTGLEFTKLFVHQYSPLDSLA